MDQGQVRILLFEDDPGDARLFRLLLAGSGLRHAIERAETLAEGLALLDGGAFDVALLDLSLPDSQGWDTLGSLVSHAPELPVIVLTGLSSPSFAEEAVARGAQDYLRKGEVAEGLIVRTIRYAIDRKRAEGTLRQHRQRLETIISANPDGMLVVDADALVRFANPAALTMLGRERPDLPELSDMLGQPSPVPVRDDELDLCGDSDNPCLVEVRTAPVTWDDGPATLVSLRDITAQRLAERALREAELRYRTIFEHSLDGISVYEHRDDGSAPRLVDCNRGYERMAGRTRDDLRDMDDVRQLQVFLGGRKALDPFRDDGGLRGPQSAVYSWLRPDGRENWIESVSVPVRDGDKVLVFGIGRDVSRRRKQEEALQQSEARFRAVFEHAPLGVFISDQDGSLVKTNRLFNVLHGFATAELPLGHFSELVHGHEAGDVRALFAELHRGERNGFFLETQHLRRDGTVFPVRLAVAAIRGRKGDLQYAVGMLEDISERRAAEAELQGYRARLENMVLERTRDLELALRTAESHREKIDLILRSVSEGLLVTDPDHRVVLTNPAAEDILGLAAPGDLMGEGVADLIEDDPLRKRLVHCLDDTMGGAPCQFGFSRPTEAGGVHHYTASTSEVRDAGGGRTGVVTVLHDVTSERELDRMKNEFLTTAAHELRTPLTTILGFSELLVTGDDIPPVEQRQYLGYINEQATLVTGIVADLLDISRIEMGQGFSLKRRPCDLVALIRRKVAAHIVGTRRHSFRLLLPETPVPAVVDADKVAQVLDNVLSNAVKYSPGGGVVEVRLRPGRDAHEISVRDNGMGMSPEQLSRVFEKFYRGDASNTGIPGTGLGMSIVKYLIEAHGGEVVVESAKDVGTTVRFTLPTGSTGPTDATDATDATGPSGA
ncbi:MAG: PAS domain S-box protein [Desulfovibrio sp.]|jgi:PAS domain S-box-containing protein|nr:PAS domain S-box protein [Desulfovibrio sp.]